MNFSLISKFLVALTLLFAIRVDAQEKCKNWDFSADFLAWFASEEASSVWVDVIKLGEPRSFGAPSFHFDWDFGFRLGAGYNLEYDRWDTQLYWTWFRTEASQSERVFPTFFIIASEEIHPEFFAGDLSGKSAQSAKIRWALHFNMFDWELGRNYWVSEALSLRPFFGLKGGWINQPIRVQYDDLIVAVGGIDTPTTDSGRENVRNDFWGIGPLGGLNSKWKLRHCKTNYPSLFGDFSLAYLCGTWRCADEYNDTAGATVRVNMKKLTLGALMWKGFFGLGWDVDLRRGGSHFAARVGYEMQLWVNQLRVPTGQLVQLHGDLTLQGVTCNCQFDF